MRAQLRQRARALLKGNFIVDAHADTWGKLLQANRDFHTNTPGHHLDGLRMRRIGLNLQFAAVYTPPEYQGGDATTYAMRMIGQVHADTQNGPLALIRTKQNLIQLRKTNQRGVMLLLEGGSPLGRDLRLLDAFFGTGVRILGLTHNARNTLGAGVGVQKGRKGLTAFGKEIVKHAWHLGMLVDISHLARRGVEDVFALGDGPVITTHTAARWLFDHPRNIDQATAKEIARRNGVIGIYYVSDFLSNKPASIDDVLDHLEAILDVTGEDHVGLGSDFDGFECTPKGLSSVQNMPDLVAAMLARGYAASLVKKIIGLNWHRILKLSLKND